MYAVPCTLTIVVFASCCIASIASEVVLLYSLYEQVQQTNKDDDDIAQAIAKKLGDTPGISYTEIASKALDCGRTELAIKVCCTSTTTYGTELQPPGN